MSAKKLMIGFGALFLYCHVSMDWASVVFQSEPAYDFFRDGGDTTKDSSLIDILKKSKVNFLNKPIHVAPKKEKYIVVNPRTHRWSAVSASGKIIRSGLATAGSAWCPDLGHACRTKTGTFRIFSLGDSDCISKKFPLGEGGAPMPYCMYFNGGQALHGSHELAYANISHGCVRMSVRDARWIRFHFADFGTKVIIKSY